jgi:serine/threonine protein kinase
MTWIPDRAVERLREHLEASEEGTRYEVIEEIARGGMGTVFRATDRMLGREVALKASHLVADDALEARLATEARVLARLEHPGIVPIHDVGRLPDGRPFYVMKRVRGHTLLDHLERVKDTSERLRIFERICEPVAFAHARGCIHRDLKPENIMVGPFGEVLVMDWGVAKVLHEAPTGELPEADLRSPAPGAVGETNAGTVLGTRGFMAPEQAEGDAGAVDARADVYGLGAILFVLLTGAAPPAGSLPAAQALDRYADVPRPLRAICARALAPVPADRYPSVGALADDVARYRAGHAVTAYRETLLERGRRLASTYRAFILLVAAYLAMRVIVGLTVGR